MSGAGSGLRAWAALAACLALAPAALPAASAVLKRTSDNDRSVLAYATAYYVQVDGLDNTLTADQISAAGAWAAYDKAAGTPVTLSRAVWAGLSDGPDTAPYYRAARLYGDFKPARDYVVSVGGAQPPLAVSNGLKPAAGAGTDLGVLWRRLSADLKPLTSPGGDLGLAYSVRARLAGWATPADPQELVLTADAQGTASTNLNSPSFQTVESGAVGLSYHLNLELNEAGTPATEPIALQLLPLGAEADQRFQLMHFTPKAQLCFALPYADLPVLWINRLSGVDAPFYPLVLSLGYAHAQATNGGPPPLITDRLDGEALYSFLLTPNLAVDSRWRMSSDLTRFHDDLDLGLKIYLDEKRTKSFLVNYQNGSLPPSFRFTHALTFGWNAQL